MKHTNIVALARDLDLWSSLDSELVIQMMLWIFPKAVGTVLGGSFVCPYSIDQESTLIPGALDQLLCSEGGWCDTEAMCTRHDSQWHNKHIIALCKTFVKAAFKHYVKHADCMSPLYPQSSFLFWNWHNLAYSTWRLTAFGLQQIERVISVGTRCLLQSRHYWASKEAGCCRFCEEYKSRHSGRTSSRLKRRGRADEGIEPSHVSLKAR